MFLKQNRLFATALLSPLLLLSVFGMFAPAPNQQAPTYLVPGQAPDRHDFEAYENSLIQAGRNNLIPDRSNVPFRLVTYNIHFHRGLHGHWGAWPSNTDAVIADIKAMDPTVIVFQEVQRWNDPDRNHLGRELFKLGYKYRSTRSAKGNTMLGNMIASRVPFAEDASGFDISPSRSVTTAKINLAGKNTGNITLNILGTHLEVKSRDVRVAEAYKIIDYLDPAKGGPQDFVLAGDFNNHWIQDDNQPNPIQILRGNGGWRMEGSFQVLKWSYPKVTCWAGTAIDFIFVSPSIRPYVIGSYLYHTTSSDHLPVILDLNLSPI